MIYVVITSFMALCLSSVAMWCAFDAVTLARKALNALGSAEEDTEEKPPWWPKPAHPYRAREDRAQESQLYQERKPPRVGAGKHNKCPACGADGWFAQGPTDAWSCRPGSRAVAFPLCKSQDSHLHQICKTCKFDWESDVACVKDLPESPT